ncbi:MAG: glycosyltransferase family 2 protein [Bacteroidia bacterium]|nr:glycosyltransferase family 2 protein [Bacteroidia bacterium]
MVPRVAVVILNWNGKDLLKQFLPGLLSGKPDGVEVVVADNKSTDSSLEMLREEFPQVRIIANEENAGYAGGYNRALKQLDAEYFVLLNSDVEVQGDWLSPVIAAMDADKRIAAAQPKVRSFYRREEFEYAGAAGGFIDKYGYPFCRGRIFNTFEKDEGQYDDERDIFWATGACLFIRSTAYHEVSGLDEDFFAHMEEIDLCWRLRNRGYRVVYVPGSTVYHMGGGTLNKVNPEKTFLNFRNNLVLLCKNHAPEYFFPKMLIRMSMDGIAAFKFLADGGPAHFWAVARAHFSFYSRLSSCLVKRASEKAQIKSYARGGIYDRSLVWDYFVKGKTRFLDLNIQAFLSEK